VTSPLAVFEAAYNTGKINASDNIMFESQKKRKYGNKRNFYINLHLKDRLDTQVGPKK